MIEFPKQYCVFDTETTGVNPFEARIVEIAAKRYVAGGEPETWSRLVRQVDAIPAEAERIHGITWQVCEDEGVSLEQALREFADFAGSLAVVGHNALRYDIPLLLAEAQRVLAEKYLEIVPKGVSYPVDTAGAFKAMLAGEKQKWCETASEFHARILDLKMYGVKYNLGAACAHFGIDATDVRQHRAAGDVELTDRLYRKFILNV